MFTAINKKFQGQSYINCILKLIKLDMYLKYIYQYVRAIKITPEGTTQSEPTTNIENVQQNCEKIATTTIIKY